MGKRKKTCDLCRLEKEAEVFPFYQRIERNGEFECVGEVECCETCYYDYFATPDEIAERFGDM